jgi:hypothetical protein
LVHQKHDGTEQWIPRVQRTTEGIQLIVVLAEDGARCIGT